MQDLANQNIYKYDVSIILFTDQKIFIMATPKNL